MKDMHLPSFIPTPGLEPGKTEADPLCAANRAERKVTLEAPILLRYPYRRPKRLNLLHRGRSDISRLKPVDPEADPFRAASRAEQRGDTSGPDVAPAPSL